MTAARRGDEGQVLPFYVTMVAVCLFAALAFVVVGMAGATRSDAQGAADAAALAAAREVRDNVFVNLDLLVLTPDDWDEILKGDRLNPRGACAAAEAFAASNDATAQCRAGVMRFTVTATTNNTIGNTAIDGTEDMKGRAAATAVIEPRCSLKPVPTPTPTPTLPPGGGGNPGPVVIDCKDGTVTVDPSTPGSLTKLARQLFNVRLAD